MSFADGYRQQTMPRGKGRGRPPRRAPMPMPRGGMPPRRPPTMKTAADGDADDRKNSRYC